jgi:chemotaxis protein CheX
MQLLTDIDLGEVTESVWTSMLGFEVIATDEDYDYTTDSRHLVGCVQITGSVDAAVLVDVPEALGRQLAMTMFGMDDAEISDDEVWDALGEMANMIGGNVKGMVAGDTALSLPTVAEGRDYRVVVPGGGLMQSLTYHCERWKMRVQLIGRQNG